MTKQPRLTAGERRQWRVRAHFPFGIEVEAVDSPGVVGTVDLIYISADKRVSEPADFPAIGEVVEAVVQGYMPSGELRLSMRPEDLERPDRR